MDQTAGTDLQVFLLGLSSQKLLNCHTLAALLYFLLRHHWSCTGEDYILQVSLVYWDCTHPRHEERGYMHCGWCYTTCVAAEFCKRNANRILAWPNLSTCWPKARANSLNNPSLPAETERLDSYICNLSPRLQDCLPGLYKPKVLPGC